MTNKQTHNAYEGFETFTNAFKMVFKMHLSILIAILVVQIFFMIMFIDFRKPETRLLMSWYKAGIAAKIPLKLKVDIPLGEGEIYTDYATDIVQNDQLRNIASNQQSYYLSLFAKSFALYLIYPFLIIYFRSRAKKQAAKTHLRGTELITPQRYKFLTRKKKDKTDLPFGQVKMPIEAESKHLVIVGKSGCGKTNAANQIIERLKNRNERGIIYDSKGDFVTKFYNPERDLIFNPFDSRSIKWTLFNDIMTRPDIDAFAKSQISEGTDKENPFWKNTARGIFAACLRHLYQIGHTKNRNIWELLISEDDQIAERLRNNGEIAAKYLSKPESDTAKSIISTLVSFLGSYEYLADTDGEFSITDWVKNGTGFIFISSHSEYRAALKPLISLFLDIIALRLLGLPEYPGKKTFFILEELWTLQKLPALLDLITQSRSKGGAIILSVQEIAQLEAIYGKSGAKTIFNNCGNQLVFGCTENETAKYCSQLLGEEEAIESTRSYSLGVDKFKDGVNIAQSRQKKDILMPSEFRSLEDLHAIIKFNNYPPMRTRFDYKKYESIHAPVVLKDSMYLTPGSPASANINIEDIEIDFEFDDTDQQGGNQQSSEL